MRGSADVVCNRTRVTIDVDGVTPLFMPGTMADAHRAMGGEVVLYGKPGGVAHFAGARAGVDAAGAHGRRLASPTLGAAAAGAGLVFVVESGAHARPGRGEQVLLHLAAAEGVLCRRLQ